MPNRSRPLPASLAAVVLACVAGTAIPALAAPALDLGEPSVLSQRGQRLKLAWPYGSEPGERVSVTRFEVVSVEAPAGFVAPTPSEITISAPARRNVVFLQSRHPVDAPELVVTLRVADQPEGAQAWRLGLPPASASEDVAPVATAAPAVAPPARPARARRTAAARP
jgi:hypothetical protein